MSSAESSRTPCIAVGRHGMVASDSLYASQAGARILREGGNAIDAAAATSLALGVTRPYSTGLGGGGFLMVRFADGRVFVLDYRETAPGKSTPDMFVKAHTQPDAAPPSQFGGLAVAVPGTLAGHAALLERFGTRTLAQVVEPALELADRGFPVDRHYRGGVEEALDALHQFPHLKDTAAALRHRLLFGGHLPEADSVLQQPELAETLRAIGAGGADYFYRGPVAEAIATTVQKHGGIMTVDDLKGYRPVWREPIRADYRGLQVLLMPPPSSGGICLAETLNILENWKLGEIQRTDPGLAAHLMIEAIKHAFADRARHLGDADFVPVPVAKLTSEEYATELVRRIREDATAEPAAYGWLGDDSGTSHYCIADRWGNVVAATETINTCFGSLLVAKGTGIVLNNEMDDFTAEPGKVNAFGLTQSLLNQVEPFKRPLSSMSPTIVLSGNRPILAVGAAGGPRIITATLQVMLNVIEFGLPLDEAIARPRLHHQWQPDVVYRNNYPADDPVIIGLKQRGHIISSRSRGATVQALQIDGERLIGASDPRKGGQPVGF